MPSDTDAASQGGEGGDRMFRAHKLFAKVAQQPTGLECGDAAADGSSTSQAASQHYSKATLDAAASAGCSYVSGASIPSAADTGCPVSTPTTIQLSLADQHDPATGMPVDLSNAPSTSQATSLPTRRVASNIPMAPATHDALPQHQGSGQQVWVYPSEQMFFNAMKRKGWDPQEQDMPAVVAIHNTVNERAWQEVMAWERQHCEECANPRLKKFMGRPQDLSPKARVLNFMGFGKPFDRHDWVVDRCGTDVRYVIDFYHGAEVPGMPPAMFLDVRPALDSFGALYDRLRMQLAWTTSMRWFREVQ